MYLLGGEGVDVVERLLDADFFLASGARVPRLRVGPHAQQVSLHLHTTNECQSFSIVPRCTDVYQQILHAGETICPFLTHTPPSREKRSQILSI